MVFAEWLHPHRVLIATAAVAAGALACKDTTTPKELSKSVVTEPAFTLAKDFVGTPNGRGNVGTFSIKSKAAGYEVELKSRDNTDIAVSDIVVKPGGHSGWHKHPGPVLVVVKRGTITFYDVARSRGDGEGDDDRSCSRVVHPAGTAFIEKGGVVGLARNESATDDAVVVATFFLPAGAPSTRIDAPAPGGRNCPL